jgi:hypothetical protein
MVWKQAPEIDITTEIEAAPFGQGEGFDSGD